LVQKRAADGIAALSKEGNAAFIVIEAASGDGVSAINGND